MPYIPDINDLESALKHLHDPESLRLNPLATLDIVHERVARDQRVTGTREPPLPWIYGYELAALLRSLVDNLADRDDDPSSVEGRRTTSRPRLYARILKLRFSQGLSWNEVSAEVGRVAGHIQNKLKRPALQMLLGELIRLSEAPPTAQPEPITTQRSMTNLPPQGAFIGRKADVNNVLRKLRHRRMPIIEICGIGGVGKSELAKHVGWHVLRQERLFDAVVWLSAQESYLSLTRLQTVNASHTIRSLDDLLDITARVLGADQTALDSSEKQEQVLKTLSSGYFPHGVLLIVDNYESLPEQEQRKITEFLFEELPYPSQALITSRHEEHHAQFQAQLLPIQVRLGRMTQEDLRACLQQLLSLEQPPLVLDNQTVDQLVQAANGLPLALLWLLGQLRYSPRSLSHLLAELQNEHASSPLLSYIFDYSYSVLEQDASVLKVLHALTIFSHAVEVEALAYVAECEVPIVKQALTLLEQLSLVNREQVTTERGPQERFSIMTLTRAYTRSKLLPSEREQLLIKASHYYAKNRHYDPASRPNILSLIEWAIAEKHYAIAIDLFDRLTDGNLIGSPTRVQDCDRYGKDIVRACLALNLPERADWYTLYAVCWPQLARHQHAETLEQVTMLLKRAQKHGWVGNQALACSTLGLLYYDQSDLDDDEEPSRNTQAYETALRYLEEAADLWRRLARRDWQAIVLGRMAEIKRTIGDYAGALSHYSQVRMLYDGLNDQRGKALTMRRQAYTMLAQYRRSGQASPQAIAAMLEQAIDLYNSLGDRRGSALCHLYYAELGRELHQTAWVVEHASQARTDFAHMYDAYGMQQANHLLQAVEMGEI